MVVEKNDKDGDDSFFDGDFARRDVSYETAKL